MRVLTLNIWNEEGHPLDRMRVLVRALPALQPDVIALQEVSVLTVGHHAEVLARVLGGHWHFPDPGPDGDRPAIVSRHPIRNAGVLKLPSRDEDPRIVAGVEVAMPGVGVVPFYSTHLSYKGIDAPWRERQVVALDEWVQSRPAERPAVIGGDFNCTPDSAPIMFLTGRMALAGRGTEYRDCFANRNRGVNGWTWAERNPNLPRQSDLDRRIDFIFAGVGWRVKECRVVLDEPEDGVFASDHFGVLAELEI
jgi:endonuclease/exonuclease/phosphatase family metal-dependent hydrolase